MKAVTELALIGLIVTLVLFFFYSRANEPLLFDASNLFDRHNEKLIGLKNQGVIGIQIEEVILNNGAEISGLDLYQCAKKRPVRFQDLDALCEKSSMDQKNLPDAQKRATIRVRADYAIEKLTVHYSYFGFPLDATLYIPY
ncbi:hypothetical protein LCM20_12700 [Halobacillus litoralis]|uniref:hypothetical protein n=1 Tax=Halobacillus litoralis TaxID=45668 RepID=UPI001CD73947|nr:hypothetical protein [Halobacillus litoralis]MCA0971457.1 hypothetical protein [Halobacillus litoralis]